MLSLEDTRSVMLSLEDTDSSNCAVGQLEEWSVVDGNNVYRHGISVR